MSPFFVTGGTMKPGAPSYIPRAADEELYNSVLRGEFCTVLTTRQMGKSSLMARTAVRIRKQGVACATVDLQGKGERNTPKAHWYYAVVRQIASDLGLLSEFSAWWKQQEMLLASQRLIEFFSDVVLKKIGGPVVIFIDEVDWMIRLSFSDEFFAAIRSCFNRRATNPEFERLTFVLLGSAAPSQLIKDASRTPFNIGRAIGLADFTPEEARPLAAPLGIEGDKILSRVLYWTDGHPYLTQMICASIETDAGRASAGEQGPDLVDSVVRDKFLSSAARQQENNLKFVGDRLTKTTRNLRRVLRLYRDVLCGKLVKDRAASLIHMTLRLSGAVKSDSECHLRVRNRIYNQVFNDAWVQENMPADLKWIAPGVAGLVLLGAFSFWYLLVFPKPYVQALETAENDDVVAYNAYRALYKPFHRARADDLLAQFFERRDDRDEAILVRARGGDLTALSRLVGTDYPLLKRTFRLPDGVSAVAVSADRKLLATGTFDVTGRSPEENIVAVFELEGGREVFRRVFESGVTYLAFSPDTHQLAVAFDDRTVRTFEVDSAKPILRIPQAADVQAICFSLDSQRLATVDAAVRVFDVASGRQLARYPVRARVLALNTNPEGRWRVTYGEDSDVRTIDVASGREVARYDFVSPGAMDFSAGAARLAVAGADIVRAVWPTRRWDYSGAVFDAKTSRQLSRITHASSVDDVALSPDGTLLATGSSDGTARLSAVPSGSGVERISPLGNIEAVSFSEGGKLTAAITDRRTIRTVDTTTSQDISQPEFHLPIAVALSADGNLLVAGSLAYDARVFEVATGKPLSVLVHNRSVYAVSFSHDSKVAVIGGGNVDDTAARVFDTSTGRQLASFKHPVSSRVIAVASSIDGKLVATGCDDGFARIFDVATGREISRLPHRDWVRSVALSFDNRFLVTQTGNWLHLFEHAGSGWRPIANRYLPVIWPNTVRFLPREVHCPRCVEVARDVPENLTKLDRVNFEEAGSPIQADPIQLVQEWSARLGLTFDSSGHVIPLANP